MRSNYFDSMILGTLSIGQGSEIAVDGTHRTTLRKLVAAYVRGLSLRLGEWRALAQKRAAGWHATPAMAACPSNSASRRQRHERWMSGVVVDPGTVGIR
jgi:hypothetical protein